MQAEEESYSDIHEFQTAVFGMANCQVAKDRLSNLTGIRSEITQF
jgi:hypothetical protein